jgi:hypothetical protein
MTQSNSSPRKQKPRGSSGHPKFNSLDSSYWLSAPIEPSHHSQALGEARVWSTPSPIRQSPLVNSEQDYFCYGLRHVVTHQPQLLFHLHPADWRDNVNHNKGGTDLDANRTMTDHKRVLQLFHASDASAVMLNQQRRRLPFSKWS